MFSLQLIVYTVQEGKRKSHVGVKKGDHVSGN